jgi:hypothetical protein
MYINRIHLGQVEFARTLVATVAARQAAPAASNGFPGMNHGIPRARERSVLRTRTRVSDRQK